MSPPPPGTNPGWAYTNKHLLELGAIDGNEGDISLSCCCLGQQGLPCAWRS